MKRLTKAVRFGGAGVQIILFGFAISALGADHAVTTSGLAFSPATLEINQGDSVTWTGLFGGFHTTTSSDGLWNSSTDGFSYVFNSPGTFNYFCINHSLSGMVGTITVDAAVAANQPPTNSIDGPAAGKTFAAPANVTVQTTPADSDGSVTNVQFLLGATVLGNKATGPFSITASNLTAADYVISAIVSDNKGAKATNSVTVHVIAPSPVMVAAAAAPAPGSFQFSYSTDLGLGYQVEVSTDLFIWKSIATNSPATSNPTIFTDPNAPAAGAFYRVGRRPNP
jgi:plastocyanin